MLRYKFDAIGNNLNADIKRGPRDTDDIQHTVCPNGGCNTEKKPNKCPQTEHVHFEWVTQESKMAERVWNTGKETIMNEAVTL